MSRSRSALPLAAALLAAVTLGGAAVAAAEDVGSTPLKPAGAKPASTCKGSLQSVCATVQPTKDGSGTFVLTVFAPSGTAVKRFDVWSGTAPTKLRPKAICKAHGKGSSPEYQEGPYAITRCSETIKPKKHQTYCLTGLTRVPSTDGSTTYPVYVDAGAAGAGSATSIAATAKCPAAVAKRKP